MYVMNKYFIDRLGYRECKEAPDCTTVYDFLGYVEINITKVNKKSFRCDYDEKLYKKVPSDWHIYEKNTLHRLALDKIAQILADKDRLYIERARFAFDMLSDEDKTKVRNKVDAILKDRSE